MLPLCITNAFSLEAANRFILIALRTYIYPLFSEQEITNLVNLQTANTLNPIQAAALDLLKEATAFFAFQAYKPYLPMQAADGGLHRTETETLKPLFLRQELAIEEANYQNAIQAYNAALDTFEKNAATFVLWANSAAYTQLHTCFLQTTSQFEKNITVQYANLVFARIKNLIPETEELYIQGILGKPLYNSLKTKLLTNNLNAIEKKLQQKINAYTSILVVSNNFVFLNLTYKNGFVTTEYNQTDSYKQNKLADNNTMQFFLNTMLKNCETKRDSLIHFLNENLLDFPLFSNSAYYQTKTENQAENTAENNTFWL